jgi:hypothetical protein
LVTRFLSLVSSGHLFHNADIENLKKKQEIVDFDLKNRVDVERKLQDFENRLKDLERAKSTAALDQKKAQELRKTAMNAREKRP